ncbi:hypothetical protein [Streptomyces sp. NBC_00151]|uniref:hypothetical protein n=1 Tax=Streptomyces sp. NBC_00151 TaxID=2975669 RepID=UPI002DD881E9|nr:hypothetical protein [Streptomyces sp. NBC_00151]WRZ41874.1 hypothetical protein OG915_29845 [Streptomyces sp. NBC_00151]
MNVTEEQVQQAEAKASAAEEERDAAARGLELSPYSDVASMKHSEASRLAAQLRANARELRLAWEQQVEEEKRRASRPELEKAAATEIRAAGRDMDVRWKVLVEAVTAAQAALVVLADAGVAYDEALAGHVEVLATAGLDFNGGGSGGERSMLGADRLKVKGREFHPVEAGLLAAWALRRVAEARLSPNHHLVHGLEWQCRGVDLTHPELGEQVKAPTAKTFPAPLRLANAFQAELAARSAK